MIANNCIHFKCNFDNEWCRKHKKFVCENCPDYVITDDENMAWEYDD